MAVRERTGDATSLSPFPNILLTLNQLDYPSGLYQGTHHLKSFLRYG